jgi:hypothetical protein
MSFNGRQARNLRRDAAHRRNHRKSERKCFPTRKHFISAVIKRGHGLPLKTLATRMPVPSAASP